MDADEEVGSESGGFAAAGFEIQIPVAFAGQLNIDAAGLQPVADAVGARTGKTVAVAGGGCAARSDGAGGL